MNNNAEFYVKPSYFKKKCVKVKRKAKARAHAVLGTLTGDYTSETINYDWAKLPDRWQFINELIERNNYQDYLEIGCSTDACFRNIKAPNKIGVDPFSGGTHRMTSNQFFADHKGMKFDIIFIDGLHQYAQVREDIVNSLEALKDNGVIILHDCLPLNFYAQLPFPSGGDWNGDTWKAFVEARTWPSANSALCLIDHGLGIVMKGNNQNMLKLAETDFIKLKFKDLAANYDSWLNALNYNEAINFISKK